jgi:hypothetical protein
MTVAAKNGKKTPPAKIEAKPEAAKSSVQPAAKPAKSAAKPAAAKAAPAKDAAVKPDPLAEPGVPAAAPSTAYLDQIGETAGAVWHCLSAQGKLTLAKLQQEVKAQPNMVLHAIGWLAREGKLEFVESGRTRYVALK